jgi:hypothetical protein
MAEIKLLRLEYGDSQKNITDKLNYNFSRLISFGDGPYGKRGKIGPDGPKGPTGPRGSFGDMGDRGSDWSVGPSAPSSNVSMDGDFWMDTSNGNELYYYQSGNWIDYGFAVNTSDLFSIFGPVSTSAGVSPRSGYFISSGTPINYTFVLSDATITDGTESSPDFVTNPQYSKMVISVDGSDPGRNIMEFSKPEYSGNYPFFSKTPRFYWDQGPTADRGPYGLCFYGGDSINFNMNQSALSFNSSNGYDFLLKSKGFNSDITASQGISSSGSGNFTLNLNGGNILFSTSNISYTNSQFFISGRLSVTTSASDTSVPLQLTSNSATTGNLRYAYPALSDYNASLFSANQISPSYINLFKVYGDGRVYYNKKVNSIQTTQTITQTVSSTTSLGGSVNWTTVVPSVCMDSTAGSYYFASNGTEYNIEKSASATSGDRGICLWTPATGGGIDNNGGWLNLLNDGESINFRVNCTNDNFRYIGLNTSNSPNTPPTNNNASPNYSYYDLGTTSAAKSIDFTIVNATDSGNNSASRRWYLVYFSAWPDSASGDVICGSLCTYASSYDGLPIAVCQIPTLISVIRNANSSLTYTWNNNAIDIGAGTISLEYSLDNGSSWLVASQALPNSSSKTTGPLSISFGSPIRYRAVSYYTIAGPISCSGQISNVIITTF